MISVIDDTTLSTRKLGTLRKARAQLGDLGSSIYILAQFREERAVDVKGFVFVSGGRFVERVRNTECWAVVTGSKDEEAH